METNRLFSNIEKIQHETALVSAIITDNYMKSIYKELDDGGYMMALDYIAEASKDWCKDFYSEIVKEDTQWDEISEKHACNDWEELVVIWTKRWFMDTKKMNINL